MNVDVPDKPVPLGCVVVTMGLLFTAFAIVAFYGSHLAFSKDPPRIETGRTLRSYGIAFLVPAILMVAWGTWRVLSRLNVKAGDRGRFGNSWTD